MPAKIVYSREWKARWDGRHKIIGGRLGQRTARRYHFQRLPACYARGGGGFLSAVSDLRAGRHRRAAGGRAAHAFAAGTSATQGYAVTGHRFHRRGDRVSTADRARPPAHHVRPFDCIHRPSAACDRDIRRAARRGAAEAAVLAVFMFGKRNGGRLRGFQWRVQLTDRQSSHDRRGQNCRAASADGKSFRGHWFSRLP